MIWLIRKECRTKSSVGYGASDLEFSSWYCTRGLYDVLLPDGLLTWDANEHRLSVLSSWGCSCPLLGRSVMTSDLCSGKLVPEHIATTHRWRIPPSASRPSRALGPLLPTGATVVSTTSDYRSVCVCCSQDESFPLRTAEPHVRRTVFGTSDDGDDHIPRRLWESSGRGTSLRLDHC